MNYKFIFNFHPDEKVFPISVYAERPREIYKSYSYEIARNNTVYTADKYTLYYESNPGVRLANIGPYVGYHIGDTEYLIILMANGQPEWVYFSAHARIEGTWMRWRDCQLIDERTLMVYVALGSHAMYPTPGIKYRILGLGNDQCKTGGDQWVVEKYTLATLDMDKRIPTKITRLTAEVIPPEVTWTKTQRLYMPIFHYLRKLLTN